MRRAPLYCSVAATLFILAFSLPAAAQSFRVQCPTNTTLHDGPGGTGANGSKIKCQQLSGGDGFVTMGDGSPVYLFGFGPLSGLADIRDGKPGTQEPATFNQQLPEPYLSNFLSGSGPSTLIGMPDLTFDFNGAIGLAQDTISEQVQPDPAGVTVAVDGLAVPIAGSGYAPGNTVNFSGGNCTTLPTAVVGSPVGPGGAILTVNVTGQGNGCTATPTATATGGTGAQLDVAMQLSNEATGHVDPRMIMDVGVMNASQPAPLIAIDEDDELFLTLTNVGQIMRPDLFEQHTVHFHGYPNASAFYDGVPDASIAINVGGSFTYYYLAPDAGTYFWHCHISPPEHLQMGMVGQLYVRPRQNRVPVGDSLYDALNAFEAGLGTPPATVAQYENARKRCGTDILCSTPLPPSNSVPRAAATVKYAYNDGDGSTRYDVEYPIQMHGFDPNFHFVGMTFNPESFSDMKDKYFLLNGRSYPDTIGGMIDGTPGPMQTQSTDGTLHTSQPLAALINIPAGGRALLRISDLNVTEYHTLASLGIPMKVIGYNARLLRDMAGNDMSYTTNSITLAGGESLDVILDSCGSRGADFSCVDPIPSGIYYLYTPQLDHLSNGAENFGGMMTEVRIN